MSLLVKLLHLLSIIIIVCICWSRADIHNLRQGEIYKFDPKFNSPFQIFCYNGIPKNMLHTWQSVSLLLNHTTDEYDQYEGPTPEIVAREYSDKRNAWSLNLFSTSRQKNFKLDPFNISCIGVKSHDPYIVKLNVIKIDFWKLLFLIIGSLLFFSADKLSNNTLFYYGCGVTFGICTSFLVLIYFLSKLIPAKPYTYGVLTFGWSIGVYIFQVLWENLRIILLKYSTYVMWYMIITGAVSFIVCYRWGPVENPRTKNLIRWFLQGLALTSVFFSSHYQEAAMGQIIIILLTYNIPKQWLAAPKSYWKKKFPPKMQMLSNDEYYQQGVEETTKALKDLREFCSSPQCNQWKTALKLKDVKRFASFIEGNSHLSDEEILEYETSNIGDLTDDDESVSYSEEESS